MNNPNHNTFIGSMKTPRFICRVRMLVAGLMGRSLSIVFFFLCCILPANAVGLNPVPKLQDVNVNSSAVYDTNRRLYSYAYGVANGAASVGDIALVKIDITRAPHQRIYTGSHGLDVDFGLTRIPFEEAYANRQPLDVPPGTTLVPVGLNAPLEWLSTISVDGYAFFGAMTEASQVSPGEAVDGFLLESPGVPTIRRVVIKPDWILSIPPDTEDIDALYEQAAKVGAAMLVHTVALGPAGLSSLGSEEHWDQLIADVVRAGEIGWISDTNWQNEVLAQLRTAKDAVDAQDGTLAKERLEPVLALLDTSGLAQRNQETRDLIVLNVGSLIANTQDTPIPYEPTLILTPLEGTQSIGGEHIITAKVVNLANDNAPVRGVYLEFWVADGPHSGLWFDKATNAEGVATFRYTGRKVGLDHIRVEQHNDEALAPPKTSDRQTVKRSKRAVRAEGTPSPDYVHNGNFVHAAARANWTGGVDMVVPLFIPPYAKTQSGSFITVIEETANHGTIASPATTTVYRLNDEGASHYLGERTVPPLRPGEVSEAREVSFMIPDGFPLGWYDIVACADGNDAAIELDEANNCSTNQLQTGGSAVVTLERSQNLPPVCAQAHAEASILWPPNHKLETVSIMGVTDPENDPVTIAVTSIHQDEPTNGLGDGDTSPDGFGVGEALAQLRRERSGTGNGRVYIIGFSAVDDQGGSCEGQVIVGVPHDPNPEAEAIDDGLRFDSTT